MTPIFLYHLFFFMILAQRLYEALIKQQLALCLQLSANLLAFHLFRSPKNEDVTRQP